MPLSHDYGPTPNESFSQPWNLRNLPPEGHPEVGPFFRRLFQEALAERTRLELDQRMDVNYRMFRGNHWGNMMGILTGKASSRLSLALLSTNIQKTVANICAKNPTYTLRCNDGMNDDVDKVFQNRFDVWYNTKEVMRSYRRSALNMEVYGITIEKAIFDVQRNKPDTVVVDPYSFLPAPGYYEELNDAPYLIHMSAMPICDIQSIFGVKGINSDESLFTILGEHREDHRKMVPLMVSTGAGRYSGNYVPAQPVSADGSLRHNRAMVIEIWIRDYRRKGDPVAPAAPELQQDDIVPLFDPEAMTPPDLSDMNPDIASPKLVHTGVNGISDVPDYSSPATNDTGELYYPGGIRKVTITGTGAVLDDSINPNINPALPYNLVKDTYLFDHFPFFKANSYEDTTSLWGFSQCELVGDINLAVDKLWSNLMYHLNMALFPPLILPKDAKVSKNSIRYAPRLIIEPSSTATSAGIKFVPLPTPPAMLFQTLEALISFFDRISALEDPTQNAQGAAAASAIQMLQERASLLIQSKVSAMDYLVRQRGRCAISMWQNFGSTYEDMMIDGASVSIRGVDFVGRKIEYIVDSGSTVARSGSQNEAKAMQLFQLGAIDAEALLKEVAFPDFMQIIARMKSGQVQQALEVLTQAGLPPEVIQLLQSALQQLAQAQGEAANQDALEQDSATFGQQQGQGMQTPGQGKKPGAAPGSGSPGGAVGTPGGSPGAPSKPGIPKSQQGL